MGLILEIESRLLGGVMKTKRTQCGHFKTKLALGVVLLSATALVLNGCQSNIPDIATTTHGANAGDGYTYGTGPNKTRPYPQTDAVNINGVGGATPKYEPLSRGGNKDYTVLGQNYMVWTNCHSYQEIGTASWYGPGFHGNKTSNGETYNQKGYSAAHKNLPLPSYLKVTNLENGRAVIVRVNDRGPFHESRIIDLSEGAAKALNMTGKGTAKVKLELIDMRSGTGNIANTDEPGQNIAQGVISSIITNNTSSTTQNHLSNLGQYISEVKNGGEPTPQSKIAAGVAGLYLLGQVGEALSDDSSSSAQSASTLSSSSSTNIMPSTNLTSTNYTVSYATPTAAESGQAYVQFFSSTSQARAARIQAQLKNKTPYPIIVVSEEGLYRVRIGPIPEKDVATSLEYMKQLGYPDSFIKRIP